MDLEAGQHGTVIFELHKHSEESRPVAEKGPARVYDLDFDLGSAKPRARQRAESFPSRVPAPSWHGLPDTVLRRTGLCVIVSAQRGP